MSRANRLRSSVACVALASLAAGSARADDAGAPGGAPGPAAHVLDVPRGEGIKVTRPTPAIVVATGFVSIGVGVAGIVTGALAIVEWQRPGGGASDTLGVITGALLGTALFGAGLTHGLHVARPTVETRVSSTTGVRIDVGVARGGAAGAWISAAF